MYGVNQKWKHLSCVRDSKTGRRKPTKEYNTWRHMMQRCYNPKAAFYHLYGGNGITVCERWRNYDNFYEDMCPVPKGLSMDRINGEKGYYKENCRWATSTEQSRNRKWGRYITHNSKTQRLVEWAEEYGLPFKVLHDRIDRYKWDIEKAFTTPVRKANRLLIYNGVTKTLPQWSQTLNIRYETILWRVRKGWSAGQALEFEPRTRKRRQSIRHTVIT